MIVYVLMCEANNYPQLLGLYKSVHKANEAMKEQEQGFRDIAWALFHQPADTVKSPYYIEAMEVQ